MAGIYPFLFCNFQIFHHAESFAMRKYGFTVHNLNTVHLKLNNALCSIRYDLESDYSIIFFLFFRFFRFITRILCIIHSSLNKGFAEMKINRKSFTGSAIFPTSQIAFSTVHVRIVFHLSLSVSHFIWFSVYEHLLLPLTGNYVYVYLLILFIFFCFARKLQYHSRYNFSVILTIES